MLSEEREKLLHAYYAEAVPLDLLHSEQERLSAETAQAEHQIEIAEASFGDVEETLGKALDLLADCERAYRKAPGHLRRQWNQALFERLVIYDEGISGAEVAEPFATLADPRLPDQLSGKAGVGSGVSSGYAAAPERRWPTAPPQPEAAESSVPGRSRSRLVRSAAAETAIGRDRRPELDVT
jgi:hypothetical protein